MTPVRCGLDVWASDGFRALAGRRVGLIVNPTSVDARLRHLVDLAAAAPGVRLAALFGPEHGLRGEAQYMVSVDGQPRDRRTGVPVFSLYGKTYASLTPSAEALAGLDALVFDIQDVGARYYTYVATMGLALEAAARAGVDFFVLDRPNPLGLDATEGNLVEPGFESFVGLYPLPNRHGLTAGEIARFLAARRGASVGLHVVRCEGLSRRHRWGDTGLTFVPPSPNMPTVDTALVYPGMCLFEGTNVSEGRGTCRPFEQFGAPWLDGHAVAEALEGLGLPGVRFRPCAFTPTFDKYVGVSCEGAFLHVVDPRAFRPVRTGLAAVQVCRALGGDRFAWRTDAYEFVEGVPAFDLLCGTAKVRAALEAGLTLARIVEEYDTEAAEGSCPRGSHLLYDG